MRTAAPRKKTIKKICTALRLGANLADRERNRENRWH
jgi:hypothetical protein